jgi:hypothetical protein
MDPGRADALSLGAPPTAYVLAVKFGFYLDFLKARDSLPSVLHLLDESCIVIILFRGLLGSPCLLMTF